MEEPHEDKNARVNAARNQVNEVIDVMRDNVTRMMERENKLSDLDTRASNLEQTSIQFSTTSRRLKKKYWWENLKMKLCLGGVLLTILIIIIIVIVVETKKGDKNDDSTTTTTAKTLFG